jgi:hypothetical protein
MIPKGREFERRRVERIFWNNLAKEKNLRKVMNTNGGFGNLPLRNKDRNK